MRSTTRVRNDSTIDGLFVMNEVEKRRHIYQSAQRAWRALDTYLQPLPKACGKGCDACCHQSVDVCSWEEEPILHYIATVLDSETRQRSGEGVLRWFDFFNSITRPADHSTPLTEDELKEVDRRFREERLPCPFLMEHTCAIYPVRPLVCRRHITLANAELCRTDPHRETTPEAMHGFRQAARMFFDQTVTAIFTKPLAYAVTDVLNLHPASKPIAIRVLGNTDNTTLKIIRKH